MAKKKLIQQRYLFLAVAAVIAIVAVVFFMLRSSSSSDTIFIVDEEGNVIGEAARSKDIQAPYVGKAFSIQPVSVVKPSIVVYCPASVRVGGKFDCAIRLKEGAPGPVGMQFKIEADLLLYNANQAITFTPVSPFSGASGGINNNNPTVLLTWTNAYVPANNKIAYFTLTAGPVSGKYKVNLKDITIAYGYPIQTVNYPSAQGVIVEVR